MTVIHNIQGQGKGRHGGVFVDFGEEIDERHMTIGVRASRDGRTVLVDIEGEQCAGYNDAPALEIRMNGRLIWDTAAPATPDYQPQ